MSAVTLFARQLRYEQKLYWRSPSSAMFTLAVPILMVGAFCFCSLGLALTSVIAVATAAPAIVNGLLFPLLFISGAFYPVDSGSWLGRIAAVFPIRHFEQAVFAAFDPRAASGV